MYPDVGGLIKVLLIFAVISGFFMLWKLTDLTIWAIHHISISIHI